jgi:hypothetical protein
MFETDQYEEMVIQIQPWAGDHFPVSVIRSPAGTGGSGRFIIPPAVATAARAWRTSGQVRSVKGVTGEIAPVVNAEDTGRQLFDALFTGQVAALFAMSVGSVRGRGRRLRVRLHLNIADESIAPLARLPWELMYRQDRRGYLAMSPDTSFVRSIDVPIDLYEVREIKGPVTALFVMSNPRGDLNLKAERAAIEAALAAEASATDHADHSPLLAEFLEDATFTALGDLLYRKDYQIIHFMGHGSLGDDGKGYLLFHDGLRSGEALAEMLKYEPATRLVTLNACDTAEQSDDAGADPFDGVASALVMAGVPSVIAMQFPVADAAAIAFAARLYAEIGRGRSTDSAVDAGRQKIMQLRPGLSDWATPVLFRRDPTLTMSFFGTGHGRNSSPFTRLSGASGEPAAAASPVRAVAPAVPTPAVPTPAVPTPAVPTPAEPNKVLAASGKHIALEAAHAAGRWGKRAFWVVAVLCIAIVFIAVMNTYFGWFSFLDGDASDNPAPAAQAKR